MKKDGCAIAMLVVVLVARSSAIADDFFSSSPGPLASSHAGLDNPNQCHDCHVNGTNVVSDQKCLSCHDHNELGARISAGNGFHATSGGTSQPCKTGHAEQPA